MGNAARQAPRPGSSGLWLFEYWIWSHEQLADESLAGYPAVHRMRSKKLLR